jgi:hypothetical protein
LGTFIDQLLIDTASMILNSELPQRPGFILAKRTEKDRKPMGLKCFHESVHHRKM